MDINVEKQKILATKVVNQYKVFLIDALQHSFPSLTIEEMNEAINYSILKRYKNPKATLDNNYVKKKFDGTLLEILDYINDCEPILTSSGVLFKKHKKADNPLSRMIQGFLAKRAKDKAEMFKYPKGSAMFQKYNLFQILDKLDANAVYGCLGNCTSMYYNVYVAEAVTRQGRSYISTSIMFFEAFLADNVKFNSLNEVITYIHNVVNEKNERKLIDKYILDRNITTEECFFKIMNDADIMIWIPTDKEMGLVWDYLQGLSTEDINRIYYKNNLYSFVDLPVVSDLVTKILCELKEPFMNPNKPPKNIKPDLDVLVDMIKEYVYYKYPYIDKLDRIEYMQRDVTIISDTDSTIISFDAWYRFILNKVYNIDMPIKHEKIDMVELIKYDQEGKNENGKPRRIMCEYVEPEFDYDFYTDEVVEVQRLIEPCKLIPQDNLKYSIINIIAYVCSDLIIDYLLEYTKLTGSYEEGVKCRMVIKSLSLYCGNTVEKIA